MWHAVIWQLCAKVCGSLPPDDLPIESNRAAVMALEQCGSTVTDFTAYTDLSHTDSMSTAYAGPELYDWMLALMDEGS